MTRKNNSKIISVVHPICCGLIETVYWGRYISEARERDINMIGQPDEQQIVGIDHVNETTITQGWHYGFTH